jgi:DNA helicase-2/ATP-dependent DNA helicase PcrA
MRSVPQDRSSPKASEEMRAGEIIRAAGYDGEYGVISVFAPGERETLTGQSALLGRRSRGKKPDRPAENGDGRTQNRRRRGRPRDSCFNQEELNEEQACRRDRAGPRRSR